MNEEKVNADTMLDILTLQEAVKVLKREKPWLMNFTVGELERVIHKLNTGDWPGVPDNMGTSKPTAAQIKETCP